MNHVKGLKGDPKYLIHIQLTSLTLVLNSPHSTQRFFASWTPIASQRWPRPLPLSGSPRAS